MWQIRQIKAIIYQNWQQLSSKQTTFSVNKTKAGILLTDVTTFVLMGAVKVELFNLSVTQSILGGCTWSYSLQA